MKREKIIDLLDQIKESLAYGPNGGQDIYDECGWRQTNKYCYIRDILNEYKNTYDEFLLLNKIIDLRSNLTTDNGEQVYFEDWEIDFLDDITNLITNNTNKSLSNTFEIIRKNQEFKKISETRKFFMGQFNNYKSFKNNQNNFDNMISIMKMFQRYESNYPTFINGISINPEFKFDSSIDYSSEIIENKILFDIQKELGSIRFKI